MLEEYQWIALALMYGLVSLGYCCKSEADKLKFKSKQEVNKDIIASTIAGTIIWLILSGIALGLAWFIKGASL